MSARYHNGFYITDTVNEGGEQVCWDVYEPRREGLSEVQRYHPSLGGIGPVVKDQHGAYMKTHDVYGFVSDLRMAHAQEIEDLTQEHRTQSSESSQLWLTEVAVLAGRVQEEKVATNVALLGMIATIVFTFLLKAGVI